MENEQKKSGNIYIKILVNMIIYALGILFFILLFPKLFKFFLPFIIAWIISSIANPLVKFLEKRIKILRKHSSALIILLVIGLIILAMYGIIYLIISQAQILIKDMPHIFEIVIDRLNQVVESVSGFIGIAPEEAQKTFDTFISSIAETYTGRIDSADISEFTINFARNVIDVVLMTLIVIISAYFFIKDRDTIIEKAREKVSNSVLEKYDMIIHYFKYAVGGYFKAQFKIMFILIIIMFIGFKIIGAKYAVLISILTGILDVLPVFGTGAVLWPWALVEFILGNYFEAVALLVIYLLCQLVKNILQPKMVGDSVGLNPLTTLLFMYIGYRFGGFLGLIIAIPVGLILVNLSRAGMFDNIKRGFKILFDGLNKYRKF